MALPSQSPHPGKHAPGWHANSPDTAPRTHDVVRFVPGAHTFPHAPHDSWLLRSVSHPLAAYRSQSAQSGAQVTTAHLPLAHALVTRWSDALEGSGQDCPHPPQCVGLVPVLVSHPSRPSALQSPNPPAHPVTRQNPTAEPAGASHTDIVPLPLLHVMPHPPQCAATFSGCSHPLVASPSQLPHPA